MSVCARAFPRSLPSLALRRKRYASRVPTRGAPQGATSTTASTSTGVASKRGANSEKLRHVRAHQQRSRTTSREKKREAFRADTHTHAQNMPTNISACVEKTALQTLYRHPSVTPLSPIPTQDSLRCTREGWRGAQAQAHTPACAAPQRDAVHSVRFVCVCVKNSCK